MTDKSSFENVELWRKEFLNKLQPPEGDEYPFILIGNKNDRVDFPFVNEDDIKEYCSSHYDMPYFSCSALKDDNVEEAFAKMAELALKRVNEKKIAVSDTINYIKINKTEKHSNNKEEILGNNKNQKKKNNNFCCF